MSSGGGGTVIGYKYYMGMHMGICRGPVDALVKIKVGDKVAWPLPGTVVVTGGTTTVYNPETGMIDYTYTDETYESFEAPAPITASSYNVPIVAPELFGGTAKEGGIEGTMDVMMGGDTQPLNARILALVGGSVLSAFRGMLTIFFDGMVTAMNPYPKPWKFQVRRAIQGWDRPTFFSQTAVILVGEQVAENYESYFEFFQNLDNYTFTNVGFEPIATTVDDWFVLSEDEDDPSGFSHAFRMLPGFDEYQSGVRRMTRDVSTVQGASKLSFYYRVISPFPASPYTPPHAKGVEMYLKGLHGATITPSIVFRALDAPPFATPPQHTRFTGWALPGCVTTGSPIFVPTPGEWYFCEAIFQTAGAGEGAVFRITDSSGDEVLYLTMSLVLPLSNFTVLEFISNFPDTGRQIDTEIKQLRMTIPATGQIRAMNPAHIIYECYTNGDWGRGLDPDQWLNTDSFVTAAQALFDEGFGLCLKWTRQDTIEAFVQQVINHIGAVVYPSREDGLINLKLIRNDYDPETLPVFTTDTGILRIDEDQTSFPHTAINELIVSYIDATTGDPRQVRVQNLASMQSSGAINSKTVEYPGIPHADLALRVAQRDLRVHSADLRRLTLVMDRRAHTLNPGSVFIIDDAARNLDNVIVRVGAIDDDEQGQFIVQVVQDVFGLSAASYASAPVTGTPPSTDPLPALEGRIVEASYYDLLRRMTGPEFSALTEEEAYVFLLGARPQTISPDYRVRTGIEGTGLVNHTLGSWTPYYELAEAITPLQVEVDITPIVAAETLTIGDLAMIDNEVVQVIDIIDSDTIKIVRGCLDTIPAAHAEDAGVWFLSLGVGIDTTRYAESDTIQGQIITRTGTGELSPFDAETLEITLNARHSRPYPAAQLEIEGTPFDEVSSADPGFEATWVHRNRVTQADVVLNHTSPNVTPSGGLTYTVRIRSQVDNSIIREETGITTNNWTYDPGDWTTDGEPGSIFFDLVSVEDGRESWQFYHLPLVLVSDGFGVNWGTSWGAPP